MAHSSNSLLDLEPQADEEQARERATTLYVPGLQRSFEQKPLADALDSGIWKQIRKKSPTFEGGATMNTWDKNL